MSSWSKGTHGSRFRRCGGRLEGVGEDESRRRGIHAKGARATRATSPTGRLRHILLPMMPFRIRGVTRTSVLALVAFSSGCSPYGPDLIATGSVNLVRSVPGNLTVLVHAYALSESEVRVSGRGRKRGSFRGLMAIRLRDSQRNILSEQTVSLIGRRQGRFGHFGVSHFSSDMTVDPRRVHSVEVVFPAAQR